MALAFRHEIMAIFPRPKYISMDEKRRSAHDFGGNAPMREDSLKTLARVFKGEAKKLQSVDKKIKKCEMAQQILLKAKAERKGVHNEAEHRYPRGMAVGVREFCGEKQAEDPALGALRQKREQIYQTCVELAALLSKHDHAQVLANIKPSDKFIREILFAVIAVALVRLAELTLFVSTAAKGTIILATTAATYLIWRFSLQLLIKRQDRMRNSAPHDRTVKLYLDISNRQESYPDFGALQTRDNMQQSREYPNTAGLVK